MDSFIYALVLMPALVELLPRSGIPSTTANVGYYGGLLFALFLMGWGMALIWGPLADRFGRVRTLMLTILCYSLFTLLSAFARGVMALTLFRLLAGLGIGGAWSMGGVFVSEEWPEERRKMGAGLMHTGYYFGFFLAALANSAIGSHFGWRAMFAMGGLPAILAAFIYYRVKEPGPLGNQTQSGPPRPGNPPGLPDALFERVSHAHRSQLHLFGGIDHWVVGQLRLRTRGGHRSCDA
jgi:MFS family permease